LQRAGFAENILKAKNRALELRDSLKAGRIQLEEANIEARIFAERINRVGRDVGFDLGDISSLDEFLKTIEDRSVQIREIAVTNPTQIGDLIYDQLKLFDKYVPHQ